MNEKQRERNKEGYRRWLKEKLARIRANNSRR